MRDFRLLVFLFACLASTLAWPVHAQLYQFDPTAPRDNASMARTSVLVSELPADGRQLVMYPYLSEDQLFSNMVSSVKIMAQSAITTTESLQIDVSIARCDVNGVVIDGATPVKWAPGSIGSYGEKSGLYLGEYLHLYTIQFDDSDFNGRYRVIIHIKNQNGGAVQTIKINMFRGDNGPSPLAYELVGLATRKATNISSYTFTGRFPFGRPLPMRVGVHRAEALMYTSVSLSPSADDSGLSIRFGGSMRSGKTKKYDVSIWDPQTQELLYANGLIRAEGVYYPSSASWSGFIPESDK